MSFNVKALGAFRKLGAVALITATIFFVACKQTSGGGGGGKPTPKPKHAITFSVEGGNGTIKAKAEGLPETEASPITIEQGKVITFKAEAKAGYSVKSWTLDGKPITLAGTKAEYQHTVTAPATIKVSFLAGSATYTVKHYQERAEGGYPLEPTESETLNGTVDGEAAYTAKTYEGFTQKADFTKINGRLTQAGTVLADGNTIVELFYERNTVSLTFHLAGGNIEGKTDDIVKTGKYGTPFIAPAEPAKATGIFKGWKPQLPTPLLFPASNAEHTAEWTPKAFLTLEAGKNTVKVKAKTADGSAIKVEGCSVNELANEAETTLTVTNPERKLALIGDIIELDCRGSEDASNRPLVALDVSGCTALQKLDCAKNQLTALNVQGLKDLQELNCQYNQIPELKVQGLTKLQKLECQGNKITALNASKCTALKELQCNDNVQLATLNVQGCTALQKLNCRFNKIAELDVSGLTALQELDCQSNQLKTLDVQGLTALQKLDCSSNQLITLNVRGLTALQELYCEKNQLATLNVQGCASLQKLYCNGSEAHRYLSELNVQGCTALKELLCYQNKLNADVFTKLFNDLPTREASDGATAILYVDEEDVTEENCTDFTQPESLKKAFEDAKNVKHWKMQKTNGYIEEDI